MNLLLNTLIFIPIIFGSGDANAQAIPEPTPIVTPEPEPTPEPTPIATPEPEPTPNPHLVQSRQGLPLPCEDIPERFINVPGISPHADELTMCNQVFFADTGNGMAPWSTFPYPPTLYEDGSFTVDMWTKGKFCPRETHNYCVTQFTGCAYDWGCTP